MLNINKAINRILIDNAAVAALIGDRVFPVIAPDKDNTGNTIDYPLIIINRESVDTQYAKSMCVSSEARVSVSCYAVDYAQAIDLITVAKNALLGYKGVVEGINIKGIRVVEVPPESFVDGAFAESMLLEVR